MVPSEPWLVAADQDLLASLEGVGQRAGPAGLDGDRVAGAMVHASHG